MELEVVSYQQVINGYEPTGDKYGLASYTIAEPRKTAFLSNPSLVDLTKPMIILAKDNEMIVGRVMNLPSRFWADGNIYETVGGSALEVAEEYRNGDAGIMLMAYNMQQKKYVATIASGFSRVAAKCHKAMGSQMFTFPQLVQVRNYSKILPVMGVPVWIAKLFGWLPSIAFWPIRQYANWIGLRRQKRFTVKQTDSIPSWVDDIVFKDGHKYMEVHDQKWFQWNLDNLFHSNKLNKTSFFTVSKDGDNLGFFMTKERLSSIESRGIRDSVFGSIVEWGTKDSSILSEYDLQIMALSSFSRNVDLVYMATTNDVVVKRMKRLFLLRMRDAEVAFKDLSKQFKNAKDMTQWRLRLGYADTILG